MLWLVLKWFSYCLESAMSIYQYSLVVGRAMHEDQKEKEGGREGSFEIPASCHVRCVLNSPELMPGRISPLMVVTAGSF